MNVKNYVRTIACAIAAAVVLFALGACSGSNNADTARIYANGANTITLNEDFTFSAKLPHGLTKSGTYSETVDALGVTTIIFTVNGAQASGIIRNNVLSIPSEWEDSHGHGSNFALRK